MGDIFNVSSITHKPVVHCIRGLLKGLFTTSPKNLREAIITQVPGTGSTILYEFCAKGAIVVSVVFWLGV